MCIIVDTNVVHRILHPDGPHPDYEPVHDAIVRGNRRLDLVYGGELAREYDGIAWMRPLLRVLGDAGRATAIPDDKVDKAAAALVQAGTCRSDDYHVIALAQLTRARVLCTDDEKLHADFGDHHLVKKPRGKIYRNTTHVELLKRTCG